MTGRFLLQNDRLAAKIPHPASPRQTVFALKADVGERCVCV